MVAPTSLVERRYISRYGTDEVGLMVHKNGVLADADTNVLATMVITGTPTAVFTDRVAEHPSVGTYVFNFLSSDTDVPGDYDITWNYSIDIIPQLYGSFIQVGQSSPAYDNLPPEFKDVIENTYIQFLDLFDSSHGGPNLQDYFQTNFNRGRLAQLLGFAISYFNTAMQPAQSFGVYPPNQFPVGTHPGYLEQALTVEIIKHLMRSYVEQPEAINVGTARLDRRDYLQRWQTIYEMEKAELDRATEIIKMSYLGLGRPSVLVSGGVYGNYAPTRLAYSAAARPRYWTRFY
jgi:hypothetical protein